MNEFTFASENQRSLSDATEKSFLVAYTRCCRRKKTSLQKRARWWYSMCFSFQITRRCVVLQISLLCPSSRVRVRYPTKGSLTTCSVGFHCCARHHPFRQTYILLYIALYYIYISLFLLLFRRLLSSSFVGVRKPRGLSRLLHLRLGFRHVSLHVSRHLNTGPYAGTLHGISRADGVGDTVRGCFNGSENRHGMCAVGVVFKRRCLSVMMWIKSDVMLRVVREERARTR